VRTNPRAEVLVDGQRVAGGNLQVLPTADPATHTVTVRMDLPPTVRDLYPGMTVKLAFAARDDTTLSIPATALVRRGELQGAYVVDGGAVSLRQLRVGDEVDGRVAVLAGLAAGERVATDPAAATRWLVAHQRGQAQ
jgi:multidrug efflux pump subunit AcrA (membrane-fusion protein)